MESVITKKGQVVIPAALRRKYGMDSGSKVIWIDTGSVIKLIPISKDPIAALRGCAAGDGLTEKLLQDRREDQSREK